MMARGANGQLILHDDRIIIQRKGLLALVDFGRAGEKTIYIANISSIQYKPASPFFRGYIQFSFSGGAEHKGRAISAWKDENTVFFYKGDNKEFAAFRAELDGRLSRITQPTGPSQAPPPLSQELGRLADLRDRGVLTDDEFQIQKVRLLAG